MGDMLVKSGDWRTGVKLYENARLSRQFSAWKFRPVLDERVAHARENVARLNATGPARDGLMINSAFACMACHQE